MADLALPRKVPETEAAAVLALVPRLGSFGAPWAPLMPAGDGRFSPAWGSRASSAENRGDAHEHRHAGLLHTCGKPFGDLGVIQGDDVVVALS